MSTGSGSLLPSLAQEEVKIRHGATPINEYPRVKDGLRYDGGTEAPNHLLGAFPWCFPYGKGGFEVDRPRQVTYQQHVQWALQHYDRRFRKDMQFVFQTFGVLLKRQVCQSASLQVKRSGYQRNQEAFSNLTVDDLRKASDEETRGVPYTNSTIRQLRQHLSCVRSRVMGSDEHRQGIRSQIWGTTVINGPPSIWLTINPSDLHDPVAQLLCGEDIDLDNFDPNAGPTPLQRAFNVAADPMAAAQFFHHTVRCVLKDLLGIDAQNMSGRRRIERKDGILGRVKAYVGTVEAQGRGTLHLHIILWLEEGPTAQLMQKALYTDEFRSKVRAYIDANMNAHIPGKTVSEIHNMKTVPACSYSRPLSTSTDEERQNTLASLSRTLQFHDCHGRGCLRRVNGVLRCKRKAPFATSSSAWITPSGEWGPLRLHDRMVGFNPSILLSLRCNHDIKLLTNSSDTGKLGFYITFYATKKQQSSTNASAILATRLAFHRQQELKAPEVDFLNKRLLNRCANSLNRDHEFSAPEVISYLMGWGDRYISHHYVSIYWDSAVYALKRFYPELHDMSITRYLDTIGVADESNQAANEGQHESLRLNPINGRLMLNEQMEAYIYRGRGLDDFNFLDFFLETYHRGGAPRDNDDIQVPYLPGSPIKGFRQKRLPNHETLPQFIGKWFPRRDEPTSREMYCAQMLLLLKPWRTLAELKHGQKTFNEAYTVFAAQMPQTALDIMDNIDFYYIGSDSAARDNEKEGEFGPSAVYDDEDESAIPDSIPTVSDVDDETPDPTEEDIIQGFRDRFLSHDRAYAKHGMQVAEELNIFPQDMPVAPQFPVAARATLETSHSIAQWHETLTSISRQHNSDGTSNPQFPINAHGEALSSVSFPSYGLPSAAIQERSTSLPTTNTGPIQLNQNQKRAYDIIAGHLQATQQGSSPSQLLMIVNGCGGTGKSALIESLTNTFKDRGCATWLSKTSISGVAASRIGGMTLHSWAGLTTHKPNDEIEKKQGKKASRKTEAKRKRNIGQTRYLFIDEYSMVTQTILAELSKTCSITKQEMGLPSSEEFGGINVVLFGDIHQFAPVAASKDALYHGLDDLGRPCTLGRRLFEQFTTVVTLREQMRVTDPEWTGLLQRQRTGACTAKDVSMVRSLSLTNQATLQPNFTTHPWDEAVLVTPRHSLRAAWNLKALEAHCRRTGHLMYLCPSEDTVGKDRSPVSMKQRKILAQASIEKTKDLLSFCEIAIGMRTMITSNVATEADVANGSRGTITSIILDPREPPSVIEKGIVRLKYPPACVLVKLDNADIPTIPGLDQNVVPIVPYERTMSIGETVTRRQLPLCAAYAFTDYKSQGQTIECVIVDLMQPPKGNRLTSISAYVALSRSRGQGTIRILRNFDESLLTTPPNSAILDEDERMDGLERETLKRYIAV